jgi:hypothetical protein
MDDKNSGRGGADAGPADGIAAGGTGAESPSGHDGSRGKKRGSKAAWQGRGSRNSPGAPGGPFIIEPIEDEAELEKLISRATIPRENDRLWTALLVDYLFTRASRELRGFRAALSKLILGRLKDFQDFDLEGRFLEFSRTYALIARLMRGIGEDARASAAERLLVSLERHRTAKGFRKAAVAALASIAREAEAWKPTVIASVAEAKREGRPLLRGQALKMRLEELAMLRITTDLPEVNVVNLWKPLPGDPNQ